MLNQVNPVLPLDLKKKALWWEASKVSQCCWVYSCVFMLDTYSTTLYWT